MPENISIALNELPPDGADLHVDTPSIWEIPLREFHMDCRIVNSIAVDFHLVPTPSGVLVRGEIRGRVVLPCSRCAEDAFVDIRNSFEEFESLPDAAVLNAPSEDSGTGAAAEEQATAGDHIFFSNQGPVLDLAAICWEEFMLALPPTPLCREDCKGLCAHCGANRNEGPCNCHEDDGDPRLAVLRSLTLSKT